MDDKGRWYLRSKSYFSFGTTLHRVLQRFYDEGDQGVITTDQVMAAYEESWIDAGFTSQEEMQEAFGEGKEILERHIEKVRSQPSEAKVLMVEKQVRMPFANDFDLVGRIDRLDEYPDGTLEIIDYKSGRHSVSTEEVQTDLAMNLYQLMVHHRFPGRKVKATIIALRTGDSASWSLPDDERETLEQDVHELGKHILSKNWEEAVPVGKALCPQCDFLPLCRQHPEFSLVSESNGSLF